MEPKDCVMCGKRIHPERLAAQPRTITCSATCSHARAIRDARIAARESNALRRAREREARMMGKRS